MSLLSAEFVFATAVFFGDLFKNSVVSPSGGGCAMVLKRKLRVPGVKAVAGRGINSCIADTVEKAVAGPEVNNCSSHCRKGCSEPCSKQL